MVSSAIRRDYFTDRTVILNGEGTWTSPDKAGKASGACPYCPGNEQLTPSADLVFVSKGGALIRTGEDDGPVKGWTVRSFKSQQPILLPDAPPTYGESPFYSEPAVGYHYVVVATPNHDEGFHRMKEDQWVAVLAATQERIRWLYAQKGVAYVFLYTDGGVGDDAAGHPHFNVVALPHIPQRLLSEAEAVRSSMETNALCPMCRVAGLESKGPRHLVATEYFVAFCPWASTYPYEFWLFPFKHQNSFLRSSQMELRDLSRALHCTLSALVEVMGKPSFNLVFHDSSERKSMGRLHWHIEVYPGARQWSGLERGCDTYYNPVTPEEAAKVLGPKCRRNLAHLLGVE